MKKFLLSLLLVAALPFVGAGGPASQEERPPYWSLVPDAGGGPSGHVIVRIPPARVAPGEWDLNWFVSIYTPRGYRLPLGYVQDRGSPDDASRIVLKLPAGTHRLEITRPAPSKEGMGAFDLDKGKWIAWDQEALFVGSIEVTVQASQVRVVDITYRNPQAMSKNESGTTTRVFVWQSFALVPTTGQAADLPKKTPKPYPLTQSVAFGALEQSHLVSGLKSKEGAGFAAMALLRVRQPQLQSIFAGLSEKSIGLDWRLARVVVNAKDARAVDVLAGLVQDRTTDAKTRAPAAWAIGELGDSRGLDALKAALRDPEPLVRIYAAFALGQLKAVGAVSVLVDATRDTQGYARGTVFSTIEESPQLFYLNEQYRALWAILPVPHLVVRMSAIYALGQVGDPAAVEPLIGFLNSSEEGVRLAALQGLGNYQGPKVVEAIRAKLSDRQSVRLIAVHLLAKQGGAEVLESLVKLAKEDPDALVREAASGAAAKVRKKPPASAPGAKKKPS